MNGTDSKKSVMLVILQILREETDYDHPLKQKEIADILTGKYGMVVDRKTIRRHLDTLMELGFDIQYKDCAIRRIKDPKTGETIDSEIPNNYYIEREFTDAELRLLIDGLLFSKHLPYSQCKELVEKLEGISNKYFKARTNYIHCMPEDKTNNHQVFLNIELLDEAIQNKKKVSFKYLEYHTDKKQHIKKRPDGTDRVYIINPYQMAAQEGKYYLICNYDKYDDISNYRLDRITDLRILDEPVKPFKNLKWSGGERILNISDYMKKHVYMYSSPDSRVLFRIVKPMISDVIDMFGRDVEFLNETESTVDVRVYTNELSLLHFAKSFAPDVIILEPARLREEMIADLKKSVEGYE